MPSALDNPAVTLSGVDVFLVHGLQEKVTRSVPAQYCFTGIAQVLFPLRPDLMKLDSYTPDETVL